MKSCFRASTILTLLALASGVTQGCGDITIPIPKKSTGPAWTEDQWPKLLAEVKSKMADRKLLRVEADYRSATFQGQDPKKPENVDAWQFEKGVLRGPMPVQLIGEGDFEPSLFTWDEVALDKIPELCQTALDRLALEAGQVVGVDVQRHFDSTLEMRVKVNELRANAEREMQQAGTSPSTWKDEDLERAVRENGQVQIKVTVRGARKMGGLTANAKGEVTDVQTY